jgi:hypothetical protein
MVEIIVYRPMTLEVGGTLQFVSGHRIQVQWEKLSSEAGVEVVPVYEVRVADIGGNSFPVVNSVSPFLGSALVHVGHGPLDLCLFIWELIWS